MPCAPQRFLANDRNALASATLAPSSVLPVASQVLETPVAREGTAAVTLAGSYTGNEPATYDIEVVDTNADVHLVSKPIFSGAGSGTLTVNAATGSAQNYVVELVDEGIPANLAAADFEGVRLVSRITGEAGNAINIDVDQSTLVITPTTYSLLEALPAGAGSPTTGVDSTGLDWGPAKSLGADNIIPADANRVTFGDDSQVYLQYKAYRDTKWYWHFVPAIARDIPAGTAVNFVTGGRRVTISVGDSPDEVYEGIATVYDLLQVLKTQSALVDVDGVVAYDRSPTGQASRELSLRTDAHVGVSTGSSQYASGFVDPYAGATASTELVTATCYAVTSKDHPAAHLGAELWSVAGSLTGVVGTATTNVPYEGPDGAWGFTIPQRFPPGYGAQRGQFTVTGISYATRAEGVEPPPICVVSMYLGPNAVDETVTLRYSKRPSGECDCTNLPVPAVNALCLGTYAEGGNEMDYSAANRARLESLYEWAADLIRTVSHYSVYTTQSPFVSEPISYTEMRRRAREDLGTRDPPYAAESAGAMTYGMFYIPKTLFEVVADWERTLAEINALPGGMSPDIRGNAEAAWDAGVLEFQGDIDTSNSAQSVTLEVFEDVAAGDAVGVFYDNDGQIRVRKAVEGLSRYGFVTDTVATTDSPPTVTVYFWGNVPGVGQTDGATIYQDNTTPGGWTENGALAMESQGAIYGTSSGGDIVIPNRGNNVYSVYLALLSDRYRARMQQVLITGGISPVGKSDANAIQSGDGCWRDWGDPMYWTVVGSEKGGYAPAFNNHIYYASRISEDGKAYFTSREFSFAVNVGCPEKLVEGDTITLSIRDGGWPPSYQVGDTITMPVYGATPFYLAGGQTGDDGQTWYVTGSTDGPLPPFVYDPADSPPGNYAGGGLLFTVTPGGIPFAKGDRWSFGVTGGHFRWRKDSGTWSAAADIPAAPVLLEAGLYATFIPGAAPSFVEGDRWTFRALQPWAVSNVQTPAPAAWKWSGSTASLVADLGADQLVEMVALAAHTLPDGCTITIEGGTAPATYTWTESMTRQDGPIVHVFTTPKTVRYLRLSFTNATGGSIGYWWAGSPLTTTLSAMVQPRRSYKMSRANAGLYRGARYIGMATGADVQWTEAALTDADVDGLIGMVDHVKQNGDEPFIFVPQVTRPTEAHLVQLVADEVEFAEVSDWNANVGVARRFSVKLPLDGVAR